MSFSSDFDWKKPTCTSFNYISYSVEEKIALILQRSNSVENIVARGAKTVPFAHGHLFFTAQMLRAM